MQVIYKMDVFFNWVYAAIFLVVGIAGTLALKSPWFLLAVTAVAGIYFLFALRRPFRRHRALRHPIPTQWRVFLSAHFLFYRCLETEGKQQFERDVRLFLSDFTVEGIHGSDVLDEYKLLVAGGVATLLHGRPYWEPPIPDGVVIYPGDRFDRHYKRGKGNYAGMATQRAPMLITAGSLEDSFRSPHDGYNVVFHELAHYFDLESGGVSWKKIFTREWQKAFQGKSFLRPYAATNEAEFFAVATEVFFENPWEMKEKNPPLYEAMAEFFNIDTAELMQHPATT